VRCRRPHRDDEFARSSVVRTNYTRFSELSPIDARGSIQEIFRCVERKAKIFRARFSRLVPREYRCAKSTVRLRRRTDVKWATRPACHARGRWDSCQRGGTWVSERAGDLSREQVWRNNGLDARGARARALFIEPPNSAIVFIGIYSIFHSRSRLETYTHTHTTYDKRSTCHVILFSPRCDVILSRVVIYFFLSTQSKYVFTWWTIMYVVRREWCSDGSIIERRSREIKADNAYHGVAESCQTAPKERRSSCSPELQESLGMSIYNSYITVYSLSYSFIHL